MAFIAPILPFLSIAAGVVGAATSVIGGVQASSEAKQQAKILEKQGQTVLTQSAAEQSRVRRAGRRVLAEQRAAIGQAGIGFGGTSRDLMLDSATDLEMDVATVGYRGQLEASGLSQQAAQERARSKSALMGGLAGGIGSLVGAAADYGAATYQPSGVKPARYGNPGARGA